MFKCCFLLWSLKGPANLRWAAVGSSGPSCFKINFYKNFLPEHFIRVSTVLDPDQDQELIWVQTFYKGYQQTTKVAASSSKDAHARIQPFFQGEGPGPTVRKQSGQHCFFFFVFFLSLTYFTIYRGGPMVLLQRKLYLSKDPEVVQISQGVQLFPRVVQMLISIKAHITCDFPGEGGGVGWGGGPDTRSAIEAYIYVINSIWLKQWKTRIK